MVNGVVLDRLHEVNGWKAVRSAFVIANGSGEHVAIGTQEYVEFLKKRAGRGYTVYIYMARVPSASALYAGDII